MKAADDRRNAAVAAHLLCPLDDVADAAVRAARDKHQPLFGAAGQRRIVQQGVPVEPSLLKVGDTRNLAQKHDIPAQLHRLSRKCERAVRPELLRTHGRADVALPLAAEGKAVGMGHDGDAPCVRLLNPVGEPARMVVVPVGKGRLCHLAQIHPEKGGIL